MHYTFKSVMILLCEDTIFGMANSKLSGFDLNTMLEV